MPDEGAEPIPATLVIAPDSPRERSAPIYDWLMVGRECAGIDERHRLLVDDLTVSRKHLELRLDQLRLLDVTRPGRCFPGPRLCLAPPPPTCPRSSWTPRLRPRSATRVPTAMRVRDGNRKTQTYLSGDGRARSRSSAAVPQGTCPPAMMIPITSVGMRG